MGIIIILVVQKKSTPCRKPKNRGGSQSGVSAPPILATRKIKNTTMWTVCFLHLFARSSGRINSIEAPVVPIQDASSVPTSKINRFPFGVPDNLPLICIPPDMV